MTPKELISLGASISQITSVLEQVDTIRKNLAFANCLTNEQENNLIKAYAIFSELNQEVSELIKEKTK